MKNLKPYKPTKQEQEALFAVASWLNDSISINENYFFDDDTTDSQRDLIYNEVKLIYKSCLNIYLSTSNLPFC